MTAEVLRMPRIKRERLFCSACGTEAACDCGASYVAAGALAAKAIKENPTLSDRAIAAQLGVDHKTIGKARQSTGEYSPVDRRMGLDGRLRSVPRREPISDSSLSRVEEIRSTASQPDFLEPDLADKCVRMIAESIRTCGLMEPPPGMAACMVEAITRATAFDVATIKEAAELLRKMVERLNENT